MLSDKSALAQTFDANDIRYVSACNDFENAPVTFLHIYFIPTRDKNISKIEYKALKDAMAKKTSYLHGKSLKGDIGSCADYKALCNLQNLLVIRASFDKSETEYFINYIKQQIQTSNPALVSTFEESSTSVQQGMMASAINAATYAFNNDIDRTREMDCIGALSIHIANSLNPDLKLQYKASSGIQYDEKEVQGWLKTFDEHLVLKVTEFDSRVNTNNSLSSDIVRY